MRTAKGYEKALIWTVILIVAMTVLSEVSSGFKGILAGLTGHHWITKSFISIIFFWLLTHIFSKEDSKIDVLKSSKNILWTTVIGSLVIFLYFVWHYFAG